MPRRHRPLGAVCQPEPAAAAILRAAEEAPREIWVGLPAIESILGTWRPLACPIAAGPPLPISSRWRPSGGIRERRHPVCLRRPRPRFAWPVWRACESPRRRRGPVAL